MPKRQAERAVIRGRARKTAGDYPHEALRGVIDATVREGIAHVYLWRGGNGWQVIVIPPGEPMLRAQRAGGAQRSRPR